jgi:hypothetical protein
MNLQWASVTPKKHRHVWGQEYEDVPVKVFGGVARLPDGQRVESDAEVVYVPTLTGRIACERCGRPWVAAVVKRGRNNRSRGNAIEREIAHKLGLKRVGQYGGAEDAGGADDAFLASVKSGNGYFSERYWAQLKRLPVRGQQTAILVVTDAPGPGHPRRAYVVVELSEWIALHGPIGADDE